MDELDNLKYWEISLKNKEKLLDEYYIIDKIIIFEKEVVEKIHSLRDFINMYCYTIKYPIEEFKAVRDRLIKEILYIIERTDYVQYSEFISFWKVLDLSYSIFKELSINLKQEILKEIIEEYCNRRNEIYSKIGYSDTTIQCLYDAGVSRMKGAISVRKIEKIVEEIANSHKLIIRKITSEPEINTTHSWLYIVDENKHLFNKIKNKFNIKYEFGEQYQGKLPDVLIKIVDRLLVIEAKHIKEPGGAQNKQIKELIDFIKGREVNPNVHYVAFLDGYYFNLLIEPPKNSQLFIQREDLEKTLKENRRNFFVNTAGFRKLIEDLITIEINKIKR